MGAGVIENMVYNIHPVLNAIYLYTHDAFYNEGRYLHTDIHIHKSFPLSEGGIGFSSFSARNSHSTI